MPTLRYGDLPDQVVDLILPEAADAPLACLIHGGFWRAAYDRTHLAPLATALTAHGYAVANVEYRRVGAGGGWPTTFDDVASALDAIGPALASEHPGRVDPAATVYVGHSAGGHLALWAAHRSPTPRGVVALAPVADLVETSRLDLSRGAVRELLGGSPEDVPERYAAADPMGLGPTTARTVLVHGDLDDLVPPDFSRRYCARTGARLVALAGVEHFGVVEPGSTAWPAVLAAIDWAAEPDG
ncbi:S9 family peptidase [Cellulomonas sp. PhB150]|uniref:alpha/beta hydrolase family protein n=1 Tax=Cellulomonas sp. PhB150 TaxID=2485188 RepID=UPI000F47A443|nr:alpha/beta hydrolase [Cellulomonas sp. PhB150]ROS31345.1 prolyl oligopeptidase family protein [Cellulomonas sp. PhB150]